MQTKSIKHNALMNILLNLSNILFPLISFPYVTRVLSVDGIGVVNFYNTLGSYAVMIAGLGISTYGIRACAMRRDNSKELSSCVKELFTIKLITSIIVIIILSILALFVTRISSNLKLLFIQIIYIGFNICNLEWFYSGIEQYSYITKRAVLVRFISVLLIFVFVKNTGDFICYGFLSVFGNLVSTIINIIYSKKFIDLSWTSLKELNIIQHIKPSLTLFSAILAVSIYTSLDTLMLGFISGDTDVGLYTVSVKVKTILLTFINSLSNVLLPRLSYYVKCELWDEYKKVLSKAISVIIFLAMPITIFFTIEASESILILSGKEYLSATIGMRILMPIVLISGISNIIGNQILIPNNLEKYFSKAVTIGAIIDLIFNFILMPKYGFVGAAVATLLAEIAQAFVQLCYSKNFLNNAINTVEILRIICCAVLAGGIITILKKYMQNTFLIEFCIIGICYIVLYVVGMLMLRSTTLRYVLGQVKGILSKL